MKFKKGDILVSKINDSVVVIINVYKVYYRIEFDSGLTLASRDFVSTFFAKTGELE
jgi:hypothetical protein